MKCEVFLVPAGSRIVKSERPHAIKIELPEGRPLDIDLEHAMTSRPIGYGWTALTSWPKL